MALVGDLLFWNLCHIVFTGVPIYECFALCFYECEFVVTDRWRKYALDRWLTKDLTSGKKQNGIWARNSDWNSSPFISIFCLLYNCLASFNYIGDFSIATTI
jgi:hypothetical protein